MPETTRVRTTLAALLGATLYLLAAPGAPQAQNGPTCGNLAERLIEINDRFLSRYDADLLDRIGFPDPCNGEVGVLTPSVWVDVAWTQSFPFPIQLLEWDSGSAQYSDALTHEVIISCTDGRG